MQHYSRKGASVEEQVGRLAVLVPDAVPFDERAKGVGAVIRSRVRTFWLTGEVGRALGITPGA